MWMTPRFLISASVSSSEAAGGTTSGDIPTTRASARATSPSRAITSCLLVEFPGPFQGSRARPQRRADSPRPGASRREAPVASRARPALGRGRPHGVTLPVAGMLDDTAQELDDELGGQLRGVIRGDVEHRVDLHQLG